MYARNNLLPRFNKNQVEYTEEKVVRTQKNLQHMCLAHMWRHSGKPPTPTARSTDNRKHAQQGRAFQIV